MGCSSGPDIIEDGLVLCLDAASKRSYVSGNTWTDLKSGYNATLVNGPTFRSDNGGILRFTSFNMCIRSRIGGTALKNSSASSIVMSSTSAMERPLKRTSSVSRL